MTGRLLLPASNLSGCARAAAVWIAAELPRRANGADLNVGFKMFATAGEWYESYSRDLHIYIYIYIIFLKTRGCCCQDLDCLVAAAKYSKYWPAPSSLECILLPDVC